MRWRWSHSDRAEQAKAIFDRLLTRHGDSAELQVVLGQAHAHQGDYPAAIESLQRALQLKPTVAEANTTLGIIYLKQGKLARGARGTPDGTGGAPTTTSAPVKPSPRCSSWKGNSIKRSTSSALWCTATARLR